MAEVVVLGDVNIDIVAQLESYPPPGGDAQPLTTTLMLGGTSLNTALVLARLGIDVTLIARVGRDMLGDFAVAEMERNGLSAQWVQRDADTTTGLAYVAVTPDGQRTMLGGGGANRNLDADALPLELIANARWLHLTSYTLLDERARAATLKALATANAARVTTSLDIGTAPQRLASDALAQTIPLVDVVMPSASPLTPNPSSLMGEGRTIVHKLGADGCAVICGDNVMRVPAFHVEVVDTTGAGDAFNAGFIAGRVRGLNLRASALLGNACGAAAVTVNGAGSAFPSREMVMALLRDGVPCGWEAEARRILSNFQLPTSNIQSLIS